MVPLFCHLTGLIVHNIFIDYMVHLQKKLIHVFTFKKLSSILIPPDKVNFISESRSNVPAVSIARNNAFIRNCVILNLFTR